MKTLRRFIEEDDMDFDDDDEEEVEEETWISHVPPIRVCDSRV